MKKLFIIIISIAFFVSCEESRYEAKVVDKMFVPGSISTGTGLIGTKMVVTTNTTPEQYLVFFKKPSGDVF